MFVFWFVGFYLFHALGITLGYHRLLAHKALKAHPLVRYFFVAGGYLALQGAPVSWAATHRYHHQTTDTDRDPHSPSKGFLHALQGWIWFQKNPDLDYLVPDLMRDPLLVSFGHGKMPAGAGVNLMFCILWRLMLWAFFGPEVAAASLAAGVLAFWAPQLVNTLCHMPVLNDGQIGYRNHQTNDLSINLPILNWVTLGEALHNNHHAFPSRLSQAEPGEFDFTYETCRVLEKVGLLTCQR